MKRNPKKIDLGRKQALNVTPTAYPPVRTEEKDGKLYVTIEFLRPRWQRVLGGDKTCERSFGLDPFGQEVYRVCDGEHTVNDIIRTFSKKHHINHAEAELNVTTFLKTLISKGLVGIPLHDYEVLTQKAVS